jgi:hypothetical protein
MFQWFLLLGESSTLEVTSFNFFHGSSQEYLAWKLEVSSVMTIQHVFQHVHQLVLKYLSLTVNYFHFPLLSTAHPLAVKFVLIDKIWSLQSEVTWELGDWRS